MEHKLHIKNANRAVINLRVCDEEGKRVLKNADYYPVYHLAPYAGWMNDPTGLILHEGVYHIFYQHHPYNSAWGPMHWGHFTSTDAVHWEHQPIALAPGDEYDTDGCFSGSAVSFNGKLYLFYTGHRWISPNRDDTSIYEGQCLAVSVDPECKVFEKKGFVIKPPVNFMHFRDPKVWFEAGRWWMLCGASDTTTDRAHLLLYTTDDLEKWDDSYFTIMAQSDDKNIFMWECPDIFPLGLHKSIIMVSAQGKRPKGHQFRNAFQSGYCIGTWRQPVALKSPSSRHIESPPPQSKTGEVGPGDFPSITSKVDLSEGTSELSMLPPLPEHFEFFTPFKELDFGHDFYAPQTFLTTDGRQVLLAWMSMWGSFFPTLPDKWCGCLTIPRELSLDEDSGNVIMSPLRELESLRDKDTQFYFGAKEIDSNTQMTVLPECTSAEVIVSFDLLNSQAEKYGIWLGRGLEISIDNQAERIILNRRYIEHNITGYRSIPLPDLMKLTFRMYFDNSSVELFINNGKNGTMSSRIYPQGDGDRRLSLFAINGTVRIIECEAWRLKQSIGVKFLESALHSDEAE